jgi:polyhydroxybutyrate depolymerase
MRLSKRILLIFIALLLIIGGISRYLFVVPSMKPPPLSGEYVSDVLRVDGIERSFDYYLPAELPPNAPIVLALHQSQGHGARMRRAMLFDLDLLADQHGFVVGYPDGYGRVWNDCRAAGQFAAREQGIDDVKFLRALIGYLVTEYGADRDKVLVLGLSNGGSMVFRLALEAPDAVTAIVAIGANMPTADNMGCEPAGEPIATLIINGTADPIIPYEGGEVSLFGLFGDRGSVDSSINSARYWASLAGHAEEPLQVRFPDAVPEDDSVAIQSTWLGGDGPSVELITVYGGGHSVPHPTAPSPRIFGPVNHDFSASEAAWRFFQTEMDRRGPPVALD